MSRALRPRRSRPSYANMLQFEDEDGAGPSNAMPVEEDADSGSEFEVENADPGTPDDISHPEDDEEEDGETLDALDDTESLAASERPVKPLPKAKGKAKAKDTKIDAQRTTAAPSQAGPSLPRGAASKIYSLPALSIHHRHRAVPLFYPTGRVARLTQPVQLFEPPRTIPTNNFTSTSTVHDRVNKAWGYNIGSGPLWELLEDRAWYKEAIDNADEDDMKVEANCRPRVYDGVRLNEGWEVVEYEIASTYLPSDDIAADDGMLRPPPPVVCFFGPYDKQTRAEMKMFETRKMAEFISGSSSHILNAGAPVWGIDWCPIHVDDRQARTYTQYLAIAPFPSRSHSPNIGAKVTRPSNACIQIWTLAATRSEDDMDDDHHQNDYGKMKCAMVLCTDGGPAYELKWCPLPSHDQLSDHASEVRPRKLGLLAGSFEDGSLSIYVVPEPIDVTPPDHDASQPVYVKIPEPLLRLELEETSCWTLDWANSEVLAVGCTNGNIAIYNIGRALKDGDGPNLLPTHYFNLHQSAVRALTWLRAPATSASGAPMVKNDPTVIASGGYDGVECLTDIRDPHGNVMNRTRDVITSATFSPYGGGPVTIDHENTVKAYSASPSMLGRGHALLEPSGPVWSVHASDYHPQLAVGSADGTCMTTNALRATRRGGSVPWFVHKIYQLDYNRTSGELRMLEKFLPQEPADKPTTSKAKAKIDAKALTLMGSATLGTGVWPPIIGVHRVLWNSGNGFNGASLLASATANGLCRVDNLHGRWMKDKVPYRGIENIRVEHGVAGGEGMDEDGEDELVDEEE